MGLRVALLYNLRCNAPVIEGAPKDIWADLDSPSTLEALVKALQEGGHEVIPLEGNADLWWKLPEVHPDICFNTCEGHHGDSREAQVPAMLEMLGIPYTGSKVMALAITLDKAMTKRVLISDGLPTAPFRLFARADEPLDPRLRFPLFVKPNREGTAMGVTRDSLVHDEDALRRQLARVIADYCQPALVEEYIAGREVTVGILGNEDARVLPLMEIDFSACPPEEGGVYTSRVKTELYMMPRNICPAPLEDAVAQEVSSLALRAFRVTGCLDVARVDFRLDRQNRPYILEINPLPGLCPGVGDLVVIAAAAGMSHADLINAILDHAWHRYSQGSSTCQQAPRGQLERQPCVPAIEPG